MPGHTSLPLSPRDPALITPRPGAPGLVTNPATPGPGGEGWGAFEGRTPPLLSVCQTPGGRDR